MKPMLQAFLRPFRYTHTRTAAAARCMPCKRCRCWCMGALPWTWQLAGSCLASQHLKKALARYVSARCIPLALQQHHHTKCDLFLCTALMPCPCTLCGFSLKLASQLTPHIDKAGTILTGAIQRLHN